MSRKGQSHRHEWDLMDFLLAPEPKRKPKPKPKK